MQFNGQSAHLSTMAFVDVLIPVALDQAYSYRIPDGMALAPGDVVRVPFGPRDVTGVVWGSPTEVSLKHTIKPVRKKLTLPALSENLRHFIDWVARYTLAPKGLILGMALKLPEEGNLDVVRVGVRLIGSPPERLTPARQRVLAVTEGGLTIIKKDLAKQAGVSLSVIDGLVDAGVLETVALTQKTIFENPKAQFFKPLLSKEQTLAARVLCDSVRSRQTKPILIHGVTGSGKTEVYFEAVAEALTQNRQTLILMPEIALTTQFMERFAARFGATLATWHSGITGRKRERLYNALALGAVQVVAGARSALFLPYKDLGLIIVDEEHETAYKQEDSVHYHARDMAVVRARFESAALILASATPSLETQVNVDQGRYSQVRLPERFGGRQLPQIEAIDLKKNPPDAGCWLSPRLVEETQKALGKKEQVLFYLNRRGYAPLTLCRSCGHRYECPHCSSWLVEHRFRRALVCHLCGHIEQKPTHCVECGSVDSIVSWGPGVERIAEEVSKTFPDKRTIILSSDFSGGINRLRDELVAVAQGDYDIIIGTQLVAKGHNFPHLTVVGVIDADVGMTSGDPRASERTFQILQQVTGRSGRGHKLGKAYLQTWQPNHPVIRALLSGDEERFYTQEKQNRELAQMPPFGRLAALIISGRDKNKTENAARIFTRYAPFCDGIHVLGPVEAPHALIRGRHRFRLLIRTSRDINLQNYLRQWFTKAPKLEGGIRIATDIDPYSFM